MHLLGTAKFYAWLKLLMVGRRGIPARDFDEYMTKLGYKFAASREVTAPDTTTPYWSIIKTGNNPVFMNQRQFGFDKLGIVADVFKDAIYTGGTVDPVYNNNDAVISNFDFQLIAGTDLVVSDIGDKLCPTIYSAGPSNVTSQGMFPAAMGTYFYLAPNSQYALRFLSRSNTQIINVIISGYNGPWNEI